VAETVLYNSAGEPAGQAQLNDLIFNDIMAYLSDPVVHQAVVRQLANARQGTADTKTRGDVSGGGAKPWREKGTGRARQGSTRAPHWRHGGVVFGPHPRDYRQDMPKKARRAALRAALTSKLQEGQLRLVEKLELSEPKTREAAAFLDHLGIDSTVLIALAQPDELFVRAMRNLPGVTLRPAYTLNVVDVLRHDYLILPVAALPVLEQILGE